MHYSVLIAWKTVKDISETLLALREKKKKGDYAFMCLTYVSVKLKKRCHFQIFSFGPCYLKKRPTFIFIIVFAVFC